MALVAGQSVELEPHEARSAVRRAMLLLAAGGDPHEGLDLEGRAVRALAADLDSPERRETLMRGVAELQEPAEGLSSVSGALAGLGDEDVAWRAYACALLADEVIE